MPWYREGTVTATTGSKAITGVGTFWDTYVEPGDIFVKLDANGLPTGKFYEVDRLIRDASDPQLGSGGAWNGQDPNPNTMMMLKQAIQSADAIPAGGAYAILNTTGEMTTPRFAARLQNYIETARNLNSKPNVTAQPGGIPMAGTESPNSGKIDSAWIKDATNAVKGVVELATTAEAAAGEDTNPAWAVTPAGALALLTSRGIGDKNSPPEYPHNDLNTITNVANGGWYRYNSSLQANPPAIGTGLVCSIRHVSAITQIASHTGATKNRLYTRYYTGTVWSTWVMLQDNEEVAVTSTDDATSATAAPLKSAGGLAVAKNAWIGESLTVGRSERHTYSSSQSVNVGQSIFCTFVIHRWNSAIIDLRVSMINQGYDMGRYAHISAQLHHNHAGELVVRRTDLALHTFLAESIVISKPSGYANTTVTIQIKNDMASMELNENNLLLDIVGSVSQVEFSVGNS